jgi:hypothetical protein
MHLPYSLFWWSPRNVQPPGFERLACMLPQALQDWFIGVPNGVGALFSILCVALCFIYPSRYASIALWQQQPALIIQLPHGAHALPHSVVHLLLNCMHQSSLQLANYGIRVAQLELWRPRPG